MLEKTIHSVLKKLLPAENERKKVQKTVEDALKLCRKAARNSNVVVCGSFAKDTFLSGIRDVDIFFVLASGKSVEIEGMRDVQAAAEALGGDYEKKYSSHPYLSAKYKGYVFDLVPAYDFAARDEIRSAVDRTPLHTEYVNSHLGDKNQARLIKAFTRGIGVYGADSKSQGFSGYLCELLAVKYGSFEAVLRAAPGFAHPSEFKDPVDETRNLASAVSAESLAIFRRAAAAFLKSPSKRFFFSRSAPKGVPKIAPKTDLVLVYREEDLPLDSVHSRARSGLEKICEALASQDFLVKESCFAVNEASRETVMILRLAKKELERMKVVEGPPLTVRREYMDAFVAKHGKAVVFQKNDKLFAKQERRIFIARPALQGIGRTFLPSFAIVESQDAFRGIYRELPDEAKRKLFLFLSRKEPWQI